MPPQKLLPLATLVFLIATSHLMAALPPLSPDELQEAAELIVTGKVVELQVTSTQHGWNNSDWQVRITATVEATEKGAGVAAGDTLHIDCWRLKARPDGWAGPSGHHSIPDQGAQVRMWLRATDEGGWAPLAPNGIELLAGSAYRFAEQPAGPAAKQDWLLLSWGIGVFVVGILVVVVLAGFVAARSTRQKESD